MRGWGGVCTFSAGTRFRQLRLQCWEVQAGPRDFRHSEGAGGVRRPTPPPLDQEKGQTYLKGEKKRGASVRVLLVSLEEHQVCSGLSQESLSSCAHLISYLSFELQVH